MLFQNNQGKASRYTIRLHDKSVRVEISPRALSALAQRDKPLVAEVHLIFGCMIAKRVWFKEDTALDSVPVTDGLSMLFKPVGYQKTCRFADIDNGAIPFDYPMVAEKRKFVPDWVGIDFRAGKWVGEFTYTPTSFDHEIELESN